VKEPSETASELALAEARLAELDAERARLLRRIEALRAAVPTAKAPLITVSLPVGGAEAVPASQERKVALFGSLFRGRADVYPRRWENGRTGKSGYSPHCANEWKRGLCEKPKVKCGECASKAFVPVTDEVLLQHLRGEVVAGVYPLVDGDRCHFVAVDFDGDGWQEDVGAYASTARDIGLPVAVERSRSGDGAHAWFFFEAAVLANMARHLASYVLTEAMSRRSQIGMRSYDRLFPNQDTLPRGGFGNLIALPLQWKARQQGNSLFVDESFQPYADQWEHLARLARIPAAVAADVAREATRRGRVFAVPLVREDDDAPWSLPPSGLPNRAPLPRPLPERIAIVIAQRVFVDRGGLPPALVAEIRRLASFQNPVFYEKQAMRFSTAGIPRIITCAEEAEHHLIVPRGCLGALQDLASAHGIELSSRDERLGGSPIAARFMGALTADQARAAEAMLAHEQGILVAPPGMGKTVIAAHAIAWRGVNTLVLVHRKPLVEQWVARLSTFLGLGPKEIGVVGAGKRRLTGKIDVAMVQSLVQKGQVQDLVAGYGHVVVDECHHVSAASFERVLAEVKARYLLGLTATPRRRDGHHPIVEMQLGPVRFAIEGRAAAATRRFTHRLFVRRTACQASWSRDQGIQALYAALAADTARNTLILDDVIAALEEGRSPLLLTERRDHLETLVAGLRPAARHLVVLHGGMSARDRQAALAALADIPESEERAVIATGRYIGEGFDDPRLDTLVLAQPIAWRGTLVQYAGRLHRNHAGKREVRVYDYVDDAVPVLARMFRKRLRGYRALGYEPAEDDRGRSTPRELTIEYEDRPPTPEEASG
jgi:superfamily II DNA or RNA helicase